MQIRQHRTKITLILLAGLMLAIVLFPSWYIHRFHSFSTDTAADLSELSAEVPNNAIVFGAGIDERGQPRSVLRARLTAALELYRQGVVDTFLVTGDNRTEFYDEPAAMRGYLEQNGVPSDSIVEDEAGISTYQSCERAYKVFSVSEAVLVTQPGHLDRAIFLCRSFGMDAIGFSASTATRSNVTAQIVRESLSNIKAVYNVWLVGEPTRLD